MYLGKNVVSEASKALRLCLQRITPRIMTWTQTAQAAVAMVQAWSARQMQTRAVTGKGDAQADGAAPAYMPDYTQCVDHFAIHAGVAVGGGRECFQP